VAEAAAAPPVLPSEAAGRGAVAGGCHASQDAFVLPWSVLKAKRPPDRHAASCHSLLASKGTAKGAKDPQPVVYPRARKLQCEQNLASSLELDVQPPSRRGAPEPHLRSVDVFPTPPLGRHAAAPPAYKLPMRARTPPPPPRVEFAAAPAVPGPFAPAQRGGRARSAGPSLQRAQTETGGGVSRPRIRKVETSRRNASPSSKGALGWWCGRQAHVHGPPQARDPVQISQLAAPATSFGAKGGCSRVYMGFRNVRGEREGYGVLRGQDGVIYAGQWVGGRRDGHGTLFFGGGVFEGQWSQGGAHGKGLVHFKNGDLFQGHYRSNKKCGQGAYHWADGAEEAGEYVDGQKHGWHKWRFGREEWDVLYARGVVAAAQRAAGVNGKEALKQGLPTEHGPPEGVTSKP